MIPAIVDERLKALEKTRSDYWNISYDTGLFLYSLIRGLRSKKILELGMSNGFSTIWLASAVKMNGGVVHSVEASEERIELAKQNFRDTDLSQNIIIYEGLILDTLDILDTDYDFAFLDARKAEYIDYFQELKSMHQKEFVFVADNTISHLDEMEDFIERIKKDPDYEVIFLDIGSGLAIGKYIHQ